MKNTVKMNGSRVRVQVRVNPQGYKPPSQRNPDEATPGSAVWWKQRGFK